MGEQCLTAGIFTHVCRPQEREGSAQDLLDLVIKEDVLVRNELTPNDSRQPCLAAGRKNLHLRLTITDRTVNPVPMRNSEVGSGTTVNVPVLLKFTLANTIIKLLLPLSSSWNVAVPVPLNSKVAMRGPGV